MIENSGFAVLRRLLKFAGLAGILVALGLQIGNSQEAGAEWQYTTKVMWQIGLPLSLLALFLGSQACARLPGTRFGRIAFVFLFLSLVFLAIPILSGSAFYLPWTFQLGLSVCWGLAALCLGIFFFMLASSMGSFGAWCNCFVGSILLGLGIGEFWYLATDQPADGLVEEQHSSRYLGGGVLPFNRAYWEVRECGSAPRIIPGGYALAHHQMRKNLELFDVKYTMNEQGRRALRGAPGPVDNEVLLFGCSFTFGHALEDEESWPYRLARDLGPAWQVENYAQSGYGVMQTLCMLENHLLEPVTARNRFAFFLAIRHQVLRNDFFLGSPHYEPNVSGIPERRGKPRYGWITRLEQNFNGSQLARELGAFLTALLSRDNPDFKSDYLAMLAKTKMLLQSEYGTSLTVLLWPDMEDFAPDLEKMKIPYIFIKAMLPDWDKDGGSQYLVKPPYEVHPNALAARLIASGLAVKLKDMVRSGQTQSGGNSSSPE